MQISDLLELFADFSLFGRDVLSVSGSHVIFDRGLLDIWQVNFKNLLVVPACMVQI